MNRSIIFRPLIDFITTERCTDANTPVTQTTRLCQTLSTPRFWAAILSRQQTNADSSSSDTPHVSTQWLADSQRG